MVPSTSSKNDSKVRTVYPNTLLLCVCMMSARSRDSLFITSQLQSEWKRNGISFKVMLVGESGLGKTTFTRALLRPYVPEHLLDGPDSVDAGPVRARTPHIIETVHKVEVS